MPVSVRSFAKINIGLRIGEARADGFHELRTVYQTIALHDTIRVDAARGTGIEIHSNQAAVPQDESNTCYRMAERVLRFLKTRSKITVYIEKNLPVQGGLGAASSNAIAALLGLERVLKADIPSEEKLRMAAEVGSDLPLFLIGGTVLGIGRGEQVFALEDAPAISCVIVTPEVGISTPKAFKAWDEQFSPNNHGKLTREAASGTINMFSHSVFSWMNPARLSGTPTGVSAKGGDRAEAPLLDLVRAGIENDFERIVFPQHPELREVKRVLEREGAKYASLSGSGSSVYGFFESKAEAEQAAQKLSAEGIAAKATTTLSRREYWKRIFL
jgi:4-diphosphocytidyl-2-C-methyl-D-erythritol kinase